MGLLSWLFGSKKSKNKQNRENTERVRQQEREKNLRAIGRNPDGSMISDKKEKESESRNLQNSNTVSASSGIQLQMKSLVTKCLQLETKGNVSELQNCLFQLYSMLNKPGTGKNIVQYVEKDNLALCFAFMLQYDWVNDSDIREVWAEDGLYCIIEHLDHQPHGRQGQAEAMIILFTLLCVGRESLKCKIQDILDKGKVVGNMIFHSDDYNLGAQHVIDQISLLAVSGIRDLGPAAIPVMNKIVDRYNGGRFFESTIKRTDLMKYDPMEVMLKARFVRDVIGYILKDC
jgi:hypothetical protein